MASLSGGYNGSTFCQPINGCGTVFALAPGGQESVLYAFQGPPADGASPVASLLLDRSGNLYGTTELGGSGAFCNDEECGNVFELAPGGTETVLSFILQRVPAAPTGGRQPPP